MATKLIIARHGNTFEKDKEPRRVGFQTDLPLTQKGIAQAHHLARVLASESFLPDMVWTSELQRTYQMAEALLPKLGVEVDYEMLVDLNEIDYGVDENQSEKDVLERIGQDAMTAWEKDAVLPEGWTAAREDMVALWHELFEEMVQSEQQNYLVFTSNGVARYALLAACHGVVPSRFPLKLATGAFGEIRIDAPGLYKVQRWNIRPEKM